VPVRPPKYVKVGGHQCRVAFCSKITGFGNYDPRQNVIRVTKNACDAAKATTLLHELLHACWASTGLWAIFKIKDEEAVVRALEPVLFQVLRDNPKLIRYIQEAK
jgi:hypothetical protein